MTRNIKYLFFFGLIMLAGIFLPGESVHADGLKVKFGSIPALQSLPVYVAESRGLFSGEGLDVEVIVFNTAAEKDIALAAGSLDGCFADLLTPIAMKGNGQDIIMVARNYDTRSDRRMFAIMAKPNSKYASLVELADVPVAISSNSVVDYANEKLLTSSGLPREKIATIESKNIGLRFQMLLTGQVEVAALPEPLVTAALDKGAKILGDDSGLGETQTVLVFARKFADANAEAVKKFLKAVNRANEIIVSDPDSVRSIMVEKNRLPLNLKDSYQVPRFSPLQAPDRDSVEKISKWLHERGVLKSEIPYEHIVDAKFLQ